MDGSHRPPTTLWRISRQGRAHRDQGHVLVRAYELLLPVIRRYIGELPAKEPSAQASRRAAAGGA